MSERYGVYFMPADASALARFGTGVLGRTAGNEAVAAPAPDFPERAQLVAAARVYGFHATLKAPFELQPDVSRDELVAVLQALASSRSAVPLQGLAPDVIGGFCALLLTSTTAEQAVGQLAAAVVDAFEPFRAPLSDADRQRRQPERLGVRERENLDRYGYPYVHDTFRFHMTLSSSLPDAQPFLAWLQDRHASLVNDTCWLDRLVLAWQPDRQTPFRRVAEAVLVPPRSGRP